MDATGTAGYAPPMSRRRTPAPEPLPIKGMTIRAGSYRAQVTLPPDLGQDVGAECDDTGASPSEAIVRRLTKAKRWRKPKETT